jgi:hydrogenase maturation protease
MTASSTTRCRALVGGFGKPGMRDLDFGRVVADWFQQLEWPEGVAVEDLSCAAPLVLHRLQELRPAKVVLVGAVARGLDPPGTVRRYTVDLTPSQPDEVHRSVEETVMGMVDLDHTLTMARHWGGLPVDTVVIEIEPAETFFGLGFSDVLASCLDPVLEMVREELAMEDGAPAVVWEEVADRPRPELVEPSDKLDDLRTYAHAHSQARLQSRRSPVLIERLACAVPDVALAGKVRPWGVFVESGGDWFDAVPLEHGLVGIVVGDVEGRGVESAAAMSDLRAAARAYVVRDGGSPAALVGHLDRLAEATGCGQHAKLSYLTPRPATGEVRYASAGGCPPLIRDRSEGARFIDVAAGPPLGAAGARRDTTSFRMNLGSTLLLFTDGLVQSRTVALGVGMERLRLAVGGGPDDLEELCEHVLDACTGQLRRDDDICLLGVRLRARK